MSDATILIIGAGPAGAAASIYLTEKGYSPILIDEAEFPRDKICGDAISGDSFDVLKSFGLLDEVEQKGYKCTIKELYPSKDKFLTIDTDAVTLPRKDLDSILLTKAMSLGVKFSVKRFTGNIHGENSSCKAEVFCPKTLRKSYINARYIIIATGCQSDALFSDVKTYKFSKPDQVAYRGYYKADWPVKERKYFFLKELNPGYLWIFPMGNNIFNVGCGGKMLKARKLNLKRCLNDFICETNKTYECIGEWKQLPKGAFLRTNFTNLKALKKYPNIILAGETMGSTYPFSGGGIGKALTSGIIAAKSIISTIQGRNLKKTLSGEYISRINKEMKPSYYAAFTACNYLLTKTPLENFIYNKVFNNSKSSDIIANIICKKTTPGAVCSAKNVLKYLLNK
jgi:menaquinone-9 beta-reductase